MSQDKTIGMLGRYRVIEEIGRGGFSIIYLAENTTLKRQVALKLLLPALFQDPDAIQRFIREARTAAALNHPRIVRVFDLDETEGRLYMAMEYLPGGDLRRYASEHAPLPFRHVAGLIAQVAEALDYAHSQGVIHGDVKPGNILISPGEGDQPQARLADFGVLRAVQSSGATSGDMTLGTPYYISPEQAEGNRPAPASDQYALGVVAYELFAGRPPFEGETPLVIYLKHIREAPPAPSQANPLITPELEAVLLRALAKNPAERYPTCSEFARALRQAVASTEVAQFQARIGQAEAALKAHDPETARPLLHDALQMLPDDRQAKALLERLETQERAQSGYRQAAESLQAARQEAAALRQEAPDHPDPQALLKTLAPPPPPWWERLRRRWRAGLFLALALAALGLLAGMSWVVYTQQPAGDSHRETLVAVVRTSTATNTATATSTPTYTSTFTPTFTLTFTPTFTPTYTPTYTPTSTPLGGGSGQIAFASSRDGNSEIYVMNADGSGQTRLTNDSRDDQYPAWSPDGRQIAFMSDQGYYQWGYYYSNWEIYVMNADGSGQTNLTNNGADDWVPAWSPDGQQIAFHSTRNGNYEIYLMNADGS